MWPTWAEQAIRPYRIYGLFDPRDGVLFYIGVTRDAKQRVLNHGNALFCGNCIRRRIQDIQAAGRQLIFRVLEIYPYDAKSCQDYLSALQRRRSWQSRQS